MCAESQARAPTKSYCDPNWISPDVGRLVGELCGHKGEVLPHLDPEVGFGDAAVVCMDGMDTSHLPGYQSERRRRHTKRWNITKSTLLTTLY